MKLFKSKKETIRPGDIPIMTKPEEPIHAKCDICEVTDFRDNMVELNDGIARACRERGYEVFAKMPNSVGHWSDMYCYYNIGSGFIHAKCAKMTRSDDGNGWNFKDKPLPKEEEE